MNQQAPENMSKNIEPPSQDSFATDHGLVNARKSFLRKLTIRHFKKVNYAWLIVVGEPKGPWDEISTEVANSLGVLKGQQPGIKFFAGGQGLDVLEVASQASIPGCIGVVAFGLTKRQKKELAQALTKAKVDSSDFVVITGHRYIQSEELERCLRQILENFFEEEMLHCPT